MMRPALFEGRKDLLAVAVPNLACGGERGTRLQQGGSGLGSSNLHHLKHVLVCLLKATCQIQLPCLLDSPQRILVRIAQLLEDGRRRLGAGRLAVHHVEETQLVLDNVGDGLCVGGGAGTAAPDGVGDAGQFVGHAVGDVGAGGGARVGTCSGRVRGLARLLLGKRRGRVSHLVSRRP